MMKWNGKKRKAVYVSSRQMRKGEYQKALSARYTGLIFADVIGEADLFLAVLEGDRLLPVQSQELKAAIRCGVEQRFVDGEKVLDPKLDDPVGFDRDMELDAEEVGQDELELI